MLIGPGLQSIVDWPAQHACLTFLLPCFIAEMRSWPQQLVMLSSLSQNRQSSPKLYLVVKVKRQPLTATSSSSGWGG